MCVCVCVCVCMCPFISVLQFHFNVLLICSNLSGFPQSLPALMAEPTSVAPLPPLSPEVQTDRRQKMSQPRRKGRGRGRGRGVRGKGGSQERRRIPRQGLRDKMGLSILYKRKCMFV